MDIDQALSVVGSQHHAVLATLRRDGTPQMTPVLAAVDDADRVIISTRETAYKVRSLRSDPRAWLCVLSQAFFGRWIQVAGTVEIVSLPAAMEPLVDYYRRTQGEHDDWEAYRAAMRREQRCLLRITPTTAGPDRQG